MPAIVLLCIIAAAFCAGMMVMAYIGDGAQRELLEENQRLFERNAALEADALDLADKVAALNQPRRNPYLHDHNPLNADFHGGICPACEWERHDGAKMSVADVIDALGQGARVPSPVGLPGGAPDELWCPSVDVCGFCSDSECDGIGCIASLDADSDEDRVAVEQLHSWLRRGRLAEQVEFTLAHAENRSVTG